jgi:hypothetical protein
MIKLKRGKVYSRTYQRYDNLTVRFFFVFLHAKSELWREL